VRTYLAFFFFHAPFSPFQRWSKDRSYFSLPLLRFFLLPASRSLLDGRNFDRFFFLIFPVCFTSRQESFPTSVLHLGEVVPTRDPEALGLSFPSPGFFKHAIRSAFLDPNRSEGGLYRRPPLLRFVSRLPPLFFRVRTLLWPEGCLRPDFCFSQGACLFFSLDMKLFCSLKRLSQQTAMFSHPKT